MDWIWEHKVEVFAIVGAFYTGARLIVALTPTKEDDVWLEKYVGKPLRALAKIFGLTLKQGRKIKENKK